MWQNDMIVLLQGDSDGATIPVEEEDVLNVKFAEEPSVILWPELHVRVAREQSLSGNKALVRVRF